MNHIVPIYFETFEAREAAFGAALNRLIPARHRGPQSFWRDFRDLAAAPPRPGTLPAYVSSNPRDSLAFGSPYDVLAAACLGMSMPAGTADETIRHTAETFELSPLLFQPIRTLSGGETVRLALAKIFSAEPRSTSLVISSPFCWLAERHRPMLHHALARYRDAGKPTSILAMTGEDDDRPPAEAWLTAAPVAPLSFGIETRELTIDLGIPINALSSPPVRAGVADFGAELTSPCLLVGDNGQGKSLLAKALGRAAVFQGIARCGTEQNIGGARLLFQDVVTQTLLRQMPALAASSAHSATAGIFQNLMMETQRILSCRTSHKTRPTDDGLLAVKAMLIAVRLAGKPAALILDEPDWGLSRTDTLALVLATIRLSHEKGAAVLIISHKPWWRTIARSRLRVAKEPSEKSHFAIRITIEEGS